MENNISTSIKSDSYWTAVKELKAKYFKGIDEYLKGTYVGINNTEKVIFKETIQIDTMGVIRSGAVCKFPFPILPSNKFVYKNLRMNSNKFNTIIERCELECNGCVIDKIYGRAFNALKYVYSITDDTLFPFDFCRDGQYLPNNLTTYIYIRFIPEEFNMNMDDFSLSVDIYEIDNPDFNLSNFAYNGIISTCEFTGIEHALRSCNSSKIKLNFNNIINYIMVSIPNATINRILLQTDGYTMCAIPIADMFCYDNHYIIPFTPELNAEHITIHGINFSSINTTIIMVDYEPYVDDVANPTYTNSPFVPIYIYGIATNILMGIDGQTGLRYAG